MNYKSHTKETVMNAQKNGLEIYELDTGADGNDDMLIAEKGETSQDLLIDILNYYEIPELPDHWSLALVDYDVSLC